MMKCKSCGENFIPPQNTTSVVTEIEGCCPSCSFAKAQYSQQIGLWVQKQLMYIKPAIL
jgi:rubredoxin